MNKPADPADASAASSDEQKPSLAPRKNVSSSSRPIVGNAEVDKDEAEAERPIPVFLRIKSND